MKIPNKRNILTEQVRNLNINNKGYLFIESRMNKPKDLGIINSRTLEIEINYAQYKFDKLQEQLVKQLQYN